MVNIPWALLCSSGCGRFEGSARAGNAQTICHFICALGPAGAYIPRPQKQSRLTLLLAAAAVFEV